MEEELNPTKLIIAWLDNAAETAAEAQSKRAVATWVADATDEREGATDAVLPDELADLREYLDKRVRKDSDLQWLREDLAKYASQHAPRDIADVKGFVDWSLGEVDWRAVDGAIGADDGAPSLDARTPIEQERHEGGQ